MENDQVGSVETITVTAAARPIQRDPHSRETLGYTPRTNTEAGPPEQGNPGQGACSNSAYNTIAGQAATGADLISMGGGRC